MIELPPEAPMAQYQSFIDPVSYKHLTLPTNREGENSGGPEELQQKVQEYCRV